jgi:hypothetical protein
MSLYPVFKTVSQPISVTQANMKISAAAGAAFFDFGVNTIKIGSLIKIRNSAGRALQGYVRAAGTGETLTAELLTGSWINDAVSPFETFSSSGSTQVSGTNTDGNGFAGQALVLPLKALYKASLSFTGTAGRTYGVLSTTSGFSGVDALVASSYPIYDNLAPQYQVNSVLANPYLTFAILGAGGSPNFNASNITVKQVLTPSATGFTISSTKGGTAMDNWAQKDAAFNYNDPSGYTYIVESTLIASGNGVYTI